MRVGLVSPYSLSRPGGVQGQVIGLSRALRQAGHDVRVIGPCDGPPPEPGIIPVGNSVPVEANGSIASLAPDPAAALRTIRALWDEAFDVVHLHEPFAPGPTWTALLIEDAPLIATFHAAGTSASYRYGAPVLGHFASRFACRVAVSKDARALAASAVTGPFVTLFNGVEVERFTKATPSPTTVPTIVFVGRHEPRKGLQVLLEAARGLDRELALWVMSDGPQTEELRRRFGGDERISWLGRVTDEEKAQRLRGADVFCAPSLGGESFGVVLLEAMAARTAVVASDLSGYRNVARPEREALLVPPGDAAALASALRRVLYHGETRAALVEAGERRADLMSMTVLAERYVELYERAMTERPLASRERRRGSGARRWKSLAAAVGRLRS